MRRRISWGDAARLLHLSGKALAGRAYPAAPLFTLAWPLAMGLFLLGGNPASGYRPGHAQTWLIGLPLGLFAAILGVRIVAAEIDRRTLEIAYTVPGGAVKVLAWKAVAGLLLVLLAESLLAAGCFLFFTGFPAGVLYGCFQIGYAFLVVGMACGAWFRSEITGGMVAFGILFLAWLTSSLRISPFFDPGLFTDRAAVDRLAWAVQNRLGTLIASGALAMATALRIGRRERMLG